MAYIENHPTIVIEEGKEHDLFMSGDEFVHYLHDADGCHIIQGPDGLFYYAKNDEDGNLIPSDERVFRTKTLSSAGLKKRKEVLDRAKEAFIPDSEYKKRTKDFYSYLKEEEPDSDPLLGNAPQNSIHSGTVNNIVIYIRFADDPATFTNTFSTIDGRWNGAASSVKDYFNEVSYGKTNLVSHHYPPPSGNTILSYKDNFPRSYYEPNSVTNTNGYSTTTERRVREHTLLQNAVNAVKQYVPADLELDTSGNGRIDSVSFIIRGGNGSWGSILWAHRWALYSYTVTINGKRVYDYTFQPETQATRTILCHEMFHVFGAPDLYRYSGGTFNPVGGWCLMHSSSGHMMAYLKHRYTNATWIESIPEITRSGRYTINDITKPTNNCYMIKSPKASEYFTIEYRNRMQPGTYETISSSQSGLLVTRINTVPYPNGNRDAPPDEVYIYRPNGTLTNSGSITSAPYAANYGRKAINEFTSPTPFLSDNTPGELYLYDISETGETMSFSVHIPGTDPEPEKKTVSLSYDPSNLEVTLSGNGQYEVGTVINVNATLG